MASCPKCGATVGATQRLCRVCGYSLDQARRGDGLFARLRRWLAGDGRAFANLPRFTLSVQVTRDGQEEGHGEAVDPASLPPELRGAVEKSRQDGPAGGSVVKVTDLGPVQVTTRTVTHTYHSLDEMPPELRQRAEAAISSGRAPSATAITVVINGEKRTYSRIEDVPEPYRQALTTARRKADPR